MRPGSTATILTALLAVTSAAGAAQERALPLGRSMTSTLGSPGDPERSGRPYQVWTLRPEAAMTVQIEMRSTAFDSYLVLQDDQGHFLDQNDNGGDGRDARLIADVRPGTTYRVLSRSLNDSLGAYTIGVRNLPPRTEGLVGSIARGQGVSGTMAADGPMVRERPYRGYTFDGVAGDSIVVDLTSDDFDTFLIIEDQFGRSLAENDDWNGTLHSRVAFQLPATGRYRIIATAFSAEAAGAFTLRIQ